MRNLKKFLALVLAMMMVFSLMITVSAAPSEAEDAASKAAADKLDKLKVLEGFDGSLQLDRKITRAQMAAIVYRIMTGDLKDDDGNDNSITNFGHYASVAFSDVNDAPWAVGYIGFCANHDILVGYPDGTVKPNKYINGYQVLAMLLRAVGYGQKHEYEGDDWQWDVAHDGAKYGIYAGVIAPTNYDLGQETPRGVVAQMTENAVFDSYMVKYNALTGYNSLETTLMTEVDPLLGANQWGDPTITYRALYNWYDNVVQVVLVPGKSEELDPDYENLEHVRVDECDIAKAMGIEAPTPIESVWIDGYQFTPDELAKANAALDSSNGKNLIIGGIPQLTETTDILDPLEENSYVGGQGTELRAYKMPGGGVRIVLVNTYLAQVTSTTEATLDKNQHPVAAKATFTAWVGDDDHPLDQSDTTTGFELTTTDWALNDYALVHLNYSTGSAKLTLNNIIRPAYPVAAGAVTKTSNRDDRDLTPGSTTVGGKSYENAAQFHYFNGRNTKQLAVTNKDTDGVILDLDGNIIGLTPVASNYLLVESIQWNPNGTAKGGDVKANVVPMSGIHDHNVIVQSINGSALIGSSDNTTSPRFGSGTPGTGGAVVSSRWSDNYNAFTHSLTSYSQNDDGTISLIKQETADVTFTTNAIPTLSKTTNSITDDGGVITKSVSDKTVFFVWNGIAGEYEYYASRTELPTLTNAKGRGYIIDQSSTWLDVVVITEYQITDNSAFVGYVAADAKITNNGTKTIGTDTYQGYRVWDVNNSAWRDIYVKTTEETTLFTATLTTNNLYYFTVAVADDADHTEVVTGVGAGGINNSHAMLKSSGGGIGKANKGNATYGEPKYSWWGYRNGAAIKYEDGVLTVGTDSFNVDSSTVAYELVTTGVEGSEITNEKVIKKLSDLDGETVTIIVGFETNSDGHNDAAYILVYSSSVTEAAGDPVKDGFTGDGTEEDPFVPEDPEDMQEDRGNYGSASKAIGVDYGTDANGATITIHTKTMSGELKTGSYSDSLLKHGSNLYAGVKLVGADSVSSWTSYTITSPNGTKSADQIAAGNPPTRETASSGDWYEYFTVAYGSGSSFVPRSNDPGKYVIEAEDNDGNHYKWVVTIIILDD